MKEKANSDLNNCIHNDLDVSMDDRGLVKYCVAHVKVEISETRGFCDVELKKYIKSYVHYNICIVFILTNLQRKTSKLLSVFPARPQPPTGFFSRTTTGNNNKKKTHTPTPILQVTRQFLRRSTDLNDRRQVWSTTWRSSAAPGGWRCIQVAVGRQ